MIEVKEIRHAEQLEGCTISKVEILESNTQSLLLLFSNNACVKITAVSYDSDYAELLFESLTSRELVLLGLKSQIELEVEEAAQRERDKEATKERQRAEYEKLKAMFEGNP